MCGAFIGIHINNHWLAEPLIMMRTILSPVSLPPCVKWGNGQMALVGCYMIATFNFLGDGSTDGFTLEIVIDLFIGESQFGFV